MKSFTFTELGRRQREVGLDDLADTPMALSEKAPEFKAAAAVAAASASAAPGLPVMKPNTWFKARFPTLAEKHGEPVALDVPRNGRPLVRDLNESFMAAVFGLHASPEAPTVFQRPEGRF